MPIPNAFGPLVDVLVEATTAGTVKWTASADPDEYFVSLPKASVKIKSGMRRHISAAGQILRPPSRTLIVQVVGPNGEEVDGFNVGEGEEGWDRLNDLYRTAGRQAKGTDEILRSVADYLREGLTAKDTGPRPPVLGPRQALHISLPEPGASVALRHEVEVLAADMRDTPELFVRWPDGLWRSSKPISAHRLADRWRFLIYIGDEQTPPGTNFSLVATPIAVEAGKTFRDAPPEGMRSQIVTVTRA